MSNVTRMPLPFSPVKALVGLALLLTLAYVALIAFVMSSAVLTVGFSESVRDEQAVVAHLESEYFTTLTRITHMDYQARGYEKPKVALFVSGRPVTALR